MSGGKKTTTTSNQQQTATTALPAWMTQAGQDNYNQAAAYVNGGGATWDASKAAAYANPYTQAVQQNTLTTMNQQNQQADASLADQAQAARAYGGTRFAVQQAQQTKDQNTAKQSYLDSSNAAAYQNAFDTFNAERAAKLGGYQALTSILQGTPKDVTTTGTSSGTSTQKQSGSFLDTLMGLGQLGVSAYSAGMF